MGRGGRDDTIWEVPDDLWDTIKLILEEKYPARSTGRPREVDLRRVLDAIIFRMRTGCQWNKIPRVYGDDSTIHRHFQRWSELGIFKDIWAIMVERCEELKGVNWEWQAADASMGKARFGGDNVGPNPTDRAKKGTKRSIVVDREGGPLGLTVAGANVHDTKLLEQTLEAIVIDRPAVTFETPQNLCLDKGYDNPTGREAATKHRYTAHIRKIGEEKIDDKGEKKVSSTQMGGGTYLGMDF